MCETVAERVVVGHPSMVNETRRLGGHVALKVSILVWLIGVVDTGVELSSSFTTRRIVPTPRSGNLTQVGPET